MSHIRVNGLEGHYTIKRLKKLPKRGNSNWLYTLEKDHMSVYYLWTLDNEYEKISISDSLSFSTKIEAGDNIFITGTGTDLDPYVINAIPETASETPVTPVGNIESTNVQDALEELQTDIDIISVQSDWDQTDNTQPDFIQNKPTNTSEFINDGSDGTSLYVEENNPILPRIVSGLVDNNTAIATFIRDDSSNFSVDFSALLGSNITNTSQLINDGEDGSNPFITDQDIPIYTLDINANSVRLLSDGVVVSSEDLSLYLDDTNLSRLVNGTLNGTTGIATFTRDDSSTFDVDFSALLGGIIIDSAFSSTSTNALENQVIRNELFVLEGVSSQRPVNHAYRLGMAFNANYKILDTNIDQISTNNITFDREIIITNIGGTNYVLMSKGDFDGLSYLQTDVLDNTGSVIKMSLFSYGNTILLNYRDYSLTNEIIFENTPVTVSGTLPSGYEAFELIQGTNIIASTIDVPLSTDTRNTIFVLKSSSSGLQSIVAGNNISVDNTDPTNPIVSNGIDIQEGTWTPELVDKFTAGVTYGGNFTGTYYKIGKMVTATFTGFSLTTSGTPSNTFAIRGLPFAPNGSTNPINIYQFRASAPTPDWDEIFGNVQVSSGITEILFIIKQANNGLPETSSSQLGGVVFNGSSRTIQLSVTYTTDE